MLFLINTFCSFSQVENSSRGLRNKVSILISPTTKEASWNHVINGNQVYGNYTPRTIGILLGVEYSYWINKKWNIFSRIENEFSFIRFNSSSKYYINQLAFSLGLEHSIFKKGILEIPIRVDIGYGFHSEKYYSDLEKSYNSLKNGGYLLGSMGMGMDFHIFPRTHFGFLISERYQYGEVNINLPTIDKEKFYDLSSKIILFYRHEF